MFFHPLQPYFPPVKSVRTDELHFQRIFKGGQRRGAQPIAAAQDMGHTYVGTEHLLLALARDDTGEAAAFLLERQVYGYQVGRLLRASR